MSVDVRPRPVWLIRVIERGGGVRPVSRAGRAGGHRRSMRLPGLPGLSGLFDLFVSLCLCLALGLLPVRHAGAAASLCPIVQVSLVPVWDGVPDPVYEVMAVDRSHPHYALGPVFGELEFLEVLGVEVELQGAGVEGMVLSWCPRSVAVHLGFRARVLRLDSVLAPYPCSSRHALAHEHRHAAIYAQVERAAHAQAGHWSTHVGTDVGLRVPVEGTADQDRAIATEFATRASRLIQPLFVWMRTEGARRNAAIDTLAAYRAETELLVRSCPREIGSLHRALVQRFGLRPCGALECFRALGFQPSRSGSYSHRSSSPVRSGWSGVIFGHLGHCASSGAILRYSFRLARRSG